MEVIKEIEAAFSLLNETIARASDHCQKNHNEAEEDAIRREVWKQINWMIGCFGEQFNCTDDYDR